MMRAAMQSLWPLFLLIPYAALQARFIAGLKGLPGIVGEAPGSAAAWSRYVSRRRWSAALGGVFWLACVVASSGAIRLPRYLSETVAAAEIAFVIDASNSMLTGDGEGRRLDTATQFAARAAAAAEGASLSIVAFRGKPATICPPTRDRRAFEDALRWAGPTVTTSPGSDVGAAIDEAVRPLAQAGTARVVVVLSDGNDTGAAARAAAARAEAGGARIAFVGIGGDSPRAVVDPSGAAVRGADGAIVKTSLNETAMMDWSAAGHGIYVRAEDPGAFSKVAAMCREASSSVGRHRDTRVDADASPLLALLALSALGGAFALSAPPRASIGKPAAAVRGKHDA